MELTHKSQPRVARQKAVQMTKKQSGSNVSSTAGKVLPK